MFSDLDDEDELDEDEIEVLEVIDSGYESNWIVLKKLKIQIKYFVFYQFLIENYQKSRKNKSDFYKSYLIIK